MKKRGLKSPRKKWIGSAYRWTNPVTMDRGSPALSSILRPVFYLLKSRNVTMANYKSGFLLEDI